MIPKIIHYCWVGRNPLPEDVRHYIETWKKYCPDYKIIEWNEDNFDICANQYSKEAYDAKKWAFVSDYIRLSVLNTYGGIYMDTDVEIVRNLDQFLSNKAFSGFESNSYIPTGIIGAEKGNVWIQYLLSYYNNKSFYLEDGTPDMTTNTITITAMTKIRYPQLHLNNTFQILDEDVTLYPSDYFCPKDFLTGRINSTKNTVAIHHFAASWVSDVQRQSRDSRHEYYAHHKILMRIASSKQYHKIINAIVPFWKKYAPERLKEIRKAHLDKRYAKI